MPGRMRQTIPRATKIVTSNPITRRLQEGPREPGERIADRGRLAADLEEEIVEEPAGKNLVEDYLRGNTARAGCRPAGGPRTTQMRKFTPTSGQKLALRRDQLRLVAAHDVEIDPGAHGRDCSDGRPHVAAAAGSGDLRDSLRSPSRRRSRPAFTLVERLARPPAIHARIWSALTGPYSFPSPPMIEYMAHAITARRRRQPPGT